MSSGTVVPEYFWFDKIWLSGLRPDSILSFLQDFKYKCTMGSLLLWASGFKFSKKILHKNDRHDLHRCSKMTRKNFRNSRSGKKSGIFFFEDRALKIVFLDFSLNSKAISFKTLFCWTNISKKCQLISAVCLLFFKKFVDPILNQQFLKKFKWVSWI